MEKQCTIGNSVSISGTGLHTGQKGTLTFNPSDPDTGIRFRRIDLQNRPIVEAKVENVVDTSRGTTIAQNGVRIFTIEHIMAAIRGAGIDNVLIDIDAEEPPIDDGSAVNMINALKSVGVIEQNAERRYFKVEKKTTYINEKVGCELVIEPADKFSIDVKVEYDSKVLHTQEAHLGDIADFEKEIAPCRTFVFFHELEMLLKMNLIKGGDLSNAVVFVEKDAADEELRRVAAIFHRETVGIRKERGMLNNTDLRFENEPARHKLLDLIGDLTLIGKPLIGHVTAYKPGHFANTEFAKVIKNQIG